jgi:hypothetical protein
MLHHIYHRSSLLPFAPLISTPTNIHITGDYADVPATPPAGGDYGSYGAYKRGDAKAAEEEVKV